MILITQPRVGTSHNEILALHYAAESLGWEVYPAPTSWRLPEELIASGKVGVPYGSQTFCEVIAQQMGWELIANSFDWLAKVPYQFLKRKVEFMTLSEAMKLSEKKFIKPADDKVFDAKVYSPGELIPHESIPLDTPTLVSEVVQWDLEYRFFVSPTTSARTWSNYMFFEHIADPKYWTMIPGDTEHPDVFLGKLLYDCRNYAGPNTVASVIDVGRIPGKGWAIIETNQCWASGLYGCDPGEALLVMKEACRRTST